MFVLVGNLILIGYRPTGRSRKLRSRSRSLVFIADSHNCSLVFIRALVFIQQSLLLSLLLRACSLVFIPETLGFSGALASWSETRSLVFMLISFREWPVHLVCNGAMGPGAVRGSALTASIV